MGKQWKRLNHEAMRYLIRLLKTILNTCVIAANNGSLTL
jgi:hypothetical protein